MRPEIDVFSEGCEENLFFSAWKGGSVIVFSSSLTGKSAEAAPLLASLHAPHHIVHMCRNLSCTHSDHKSIIICY